MSLHLLPFPSYLRLPFGQIVEELPVTRNGVRNLPADTFSASGRFGYAELSISRNLTKTTCRGICGLLPFQAFTNGTIRPHEKTLVPRLKRQEELVLPDEGALGKPILLTTPTLSPLWAWADDHFKPSASDLQMVGKDNRYTLRDYQWKGPATGRGSYQARTGISLSDLGPIVIADGHHRAETHVSLGANGLSGFRHVPVCLIGADELHIGVFARVIAPELALTTLAWLRANVNLQEIAEPRAPEAVGKWLVIHQGRYYRFRRNDEQPADATDVSWLNNNLLPAACGIKDTRTDDRITFESVPDPINGMINHDFVPETLALVGFPLPKERFFSEVAAGRVLPPKSTRFEPRVPSGLVVWEGSK